MIRAFLSKHRQLLADESGAVTVDWVVLTAAVIGLALLAVMPVLSATESASNTASSSLQSAVTLIAETN